MSDWSTIPPPGSTPPGGAGMPTGGPPPGAPRRGGPPAWLLVTMGALAVLVAGGALVVVLQTAGSGQEHTSATSSSVSVPQPTPTPPTTTPPTTAPPATSPSVTPSPTSAPTTAVLTSLGVVSRTCSTSGDGDCFLSVRSSPNSDSHELYRLDEGAVITIACTVTGESVLSSVLGRRTSIWARTDQGDWVSMAFVDAPGFDPFTNSHPC